MVESSPNFSLRRSAVRRRAGYALLLIGLAFGACGKKKKKKPSDDTPATAGVPVSASQPGSSSSASAGGVTPISGSGGSSPDSEFDTSSTSGTSLVTTGDVVTYHIAHIDLHTDGTTGAGHFKLSLGCANEVQADGLCGGFRMEDLSLALTLDTFHTGDAQRNLTWNECRAAATGDDAVNPSDVFDRDSDHDLMPAGGVEADLTGPSPLCDAAHATLVLSATNPQGTGCKWWRIDVDCP